MCKKLLCIGLALLALSVVQVGVVRAQIWSSAFDPHCYQPFVGTPGVIDTIVGHYSEQRLGDGMINIGPTPDDPGGPGRIMFQGLGNNHSFSAVTMGAGFDPHKMVSSRFNGLYPYSHLFLGHYRSKSVTDLLTMDSSGTGIFPKIFWADEKGNFDTGRYTVLMFQKHCYADQLREEIPYHGMMTSDTAEDLVLSYGSYVYDSVKNVVYDSLYMVHFSGGAGLYKPHGVVLPDEEIVDDTINPYYCFSGNFRGKGRTDCIAADGYGNLFFYANDPPFSLARFCSSMQDTLLSAVAEKKRFVPGVVLGPGAITMPSRHGDDLLLPMEEAPYGYRSHQIRVLRGGEGFGSHRLMLDSAYVLHGPTYYDSGSFAELGWGLGLVNCGDMTGTGDPVLFVEAEGFLDGVLTFYVMSDVLDDKIDMYFTEDQLGTLVDTCTVDGDGLTDIAVGVQSYHPPGGTAPNVGMLMFVHGSKQIPVPARSVLARAADPKTTSVRIVSGALEITLGTDARNCEMTIHDILGRTVFTSDVMLDDHGEATLPIPPLPHGAYLIQLRGGSDVSYTKIVI